MSRPWHDGIAEDRIGPDLEALQTALFHQVIAELTEAIAGLIVAEVHAGDRTQPYIGVARPIAVAALKAEMPGRADGQGKKVRIREPCRLPELDQHVERGEGSRVGHQGQL